MHSLLLRSAELRDIDVIQSVEADALAMFPLGSLPPGTGRSMSTAGLSAAIEERLLWVACVEGAGLVGFLAAEIMHHSLHIAEMDVHPEHGRQGIGASLLTRAGTEAASRGLHWITLSTFANLPWNAPFYQKHGFAVPKDLEQFPHLQRILEEERQSGIKQRVAMVRAAG